MTDIDLGRWTDADVPEPREEIDVAELEAVLPTTNGHVTVSTDPDRTIGDDLPALTGFGDEPAAATSSGAVEDIPFAPELPDVVDRLFLRNLSTYGIRPVVWVDKPFLQRAAFHLLAGRKGVCKGTLLAGIAARCSTGELYGKPMRVLVITSEDSIELDFLPRVAAAGGDSTMVEIVNGLFRLPGDIPWIREQALALGDVGLIIVDPLGNHLGGQDTNSEGDTREAIQGLNPLADELDCIIFGVRHLSKDSSRGALSSVLGSTAFVDVPRAVILMAADDEDEMLFHAQLVAGNRGPRGNAGRAYRLDLRDVAPATEITCLIPEGESTKDVELLLVGKAGSEPASKSAMARELILDVLDEGPQESDAFDARIAAEAGISAKTVRNLRSQLSADGLVKAHPLRRHKDGTVAKWSVGRTLAPRPDSA